MASLRRYGRHAEPAWLKATVAVESPFNWNMEILKRQVAAGLARENKWPVVSGTEHEREGFWRVQLTIGAITDPNYPRMYLVSWFLEPERLYSDYDAEKLQCMADVIVAAFNEMEERYEARRAFDEPLGWVIQTPMVDPVPSLLEEIGVG